MVPLSAGLSGVVGWARIALACGIVLIVAGGAVCAAVSLLKRQWECSSEPPQAWHARAPIMAALGVVAVALLRTYSYHTGWFAYAAADLGVAFCSGLIISRAFLRLYRGPAQLAVLARGLGLLSVFMLLGTSLLAYPDLILSEAGLLRASATWLVSGRLFPLWLLAAGAGMLTPASPSGASWKACWVDALAVAAGAVGAGLVPTSVGTQWLYVLGGALCLLAIMPACLLRGREGGKLGAPIRVAVALVAVCGLAWLLVARPYSAAVAAPWQDAVMDDLHIEPWGPEATIEVEGQQGRLIRGNLVATSRAEDLRVMRAALALGWACSPGVRTVGLVGPALEDTRRSVLLILGDVEQIELDLPRLDAAAGGVRADLVIWGPGPFAGARCPLAAFNVERLKRLAQYLSGQGVVVLYLPTRTVNGKELLRFLATAKAAFGRARLLACGDELLLVAGGAEKLSLERLNGLFLRSGSRACLTEVGLWDARQLVAMLVAEDGDVAALAAGARPYRLAEPSRAPVLARNLAEPRRAGAWALATQYRLALQDRLGDSVEFPDEGLKDCLLPGIERLYRTETEQTLRAEGEAARRMPMEFIRVLGDDSMRLELFAPEARSRTMMLAVALHRFRLFHESQAVLGGAIWPKEEQHDVLYWRGRNLEALGDRDKALRAYEAGLVERPDSVDTLRRIALLNFAGKQYRQAEVALLKVLELEPRAVTSRLYLADAYGLTSQYDRAAQMAEEALALEPENRHAQQQVMLYASPAGE